MIERRTAAENDNRFLQFFSVNIAYTAFNTEEDLLKATITRISGKTAYSRDQE